MGSPARQKRLGLSFFFGLILSGYGGLSGFVHFAKNFVKWVQGSEWVCVYEAKSLDIFGKFDVFKMKVSTPFSLE